MGFGHSWYTTFQLNPRMSQPNYLHNDLPNLLSLGLTLTSRSGSLVGRLQVGPMLVSHTAELYCNPTCPIVFLLRHSFLNFFARWIQAVQAIFGPSLSWLDGEGFGSQTRPQISRQRPHRPFEQQCRSWSVLFFLCSVFWSFFKVVAVLIIVLMLAGF